MECRQCPVECRADRKDKKGACGTSGIKLARAGLHPYEEPPISFNGGSGCVFFCGCSLKCVFCQNYDVSRVRVGREITVTELSDVFKKLEDEGAENINLVNPTHYLYEIARALDIYRPNVPIVYNTHGYEKIEQLKLADELVDIYLTDLKFIDSALARRYTAREDYAKFAVPATEFMAKKSLKMREDGKMLSGCIVRHLVLPLAVYDSLAVVDFVCGLGEDVYLSLMSQYTPCGEISSFPELKRKITRREYERVVNAVKSHNKERVFLQDYDSADLSYVPKWDF